MAGLRSEGSSLGLTARERHVCADYQTPRDECGPPASELVVGPWGQPLTQDGLLDTCPADKRDQIGDHRGWNGEPVPQGNAEAAALIRPPRYEG